MLEMKDKYWFALNANTRSGVDNYILSMQNTHFKKALSYFPCGVHSLEHSKLHVVLDSVCSVIRYVSTLKSMCNFKLQNLLPISRKGLTLSPVETSIMDKRLHLYCRLYLANIRIMFFLPWFILLFCTVHHLGQVFSCDAPPSWVSSPRPWGVFNSCASVSVTVCTVIQW